MSSFTRLSTSSPENYKKLLDAHDTWMFDCDGVLWHGTHPIDGVIELLNALRALSQYHHIVTIVHRIYDDHWIEKSIIFVTNNATQSRATYKKKFDKMGIEAHVVRTHTSS
jgi:4-nitrophenyl phosphatase